MSRPPDLHELVGDLPPEEEARLRRVHDLLVAAGPPAEIPPSLATPPSPGVRFLPRRRRGALLLLAAAVAALSFGIGYWAGDVRNSGTNPAAFPSVGKPIRLHGTSRAPDAIAVVVRGRRDSAGNWPMVVTVEGLKRLPARGYYTLMLSKKGRPIVTCGTFNVRRGVKQTQVRFMVAYRLAGFDGWVVTEYKHGRKAEPVVLTT
jgi:hypothetical protein